MTIRLSKSKFVAGCQCLKRLYLQVHEPELAAEVDAASEAIIEQGREVGVLARQLFPGGVEVRSEGLDEAIRATRELTANREVLAIFEGTFEHGGVLVRVDILHRRRDKRWRLIEVKSGLRSGRSADIAEAPEQPRNGCLVHVFADMPDDLPFGSTKMQSAEVGSALSILSLPPRQARP